MDNPHISRGETVIRINWINTGTQWEAYTVAEDQYIGQITLTDDGGVYLSESAYCAVDRYSEFDNLLAAKRWITRTYREAEGLY